MKKIQIRASKLLHKINHPLMSEILSGSATALIVRSFGIIGGFVFAYLVSKNYGAEAFGVFSLSFTMLQISSLIARGGMDMALLKFISSLGVKSNWLSIKKIYIKCIFYSVSISLIISAFVFLYSNEIAIRIFNNSKLTDNFRLIAFGITPFTIIFLNAETHRAIKDIKKFSLFRESATPFIAAIIIFSSSFFLIYSTIPVIAYLISIYIVAIYSSISWYNILRINLNSEYSNIEHRIAFNEILKYASPMFLTASFTFLMTWIDTILLGIYGSEKDVGVYNVVLKISIFTNLFFVAIRAIYGPKISELWTLKKLDDLQLTVTKTSRLLFYINSPIILILFLLANPILNIFGNEFQTGYYALLLLLAGRIFISMFGPIEYLLSMTGNQIILQNILISSALINIVLNVLLIPKFGINGAAITALTTTFYWYLTSNYFIKRRINITPFFLYRPRYEKC